MPARLNLRSWASLLSLCLLMVVAGCGSDEPASPEGQGEAHAGHNHQATAGSQGDGQAQQWTCSMHPQVVEEEPGVCPICGMDLVPMHKADRQEGTVQIDPVTMQNMGVRTAEVEVAPLERRVRTTGRFEAKEDARTAISPKVSGWVERLYVDYEGARVREGQPLLEIYSPDLVATQEEYLLALRNVKRLEGTAGAEQARRLLAAAERRLAYWDITNAQIEHLEETGTPTKTMTLYAPASGTVTMKQVTEGQQVQAGATLLETTDLNRLWLMVDVYEQDLAWVRTGSPVTITLPYEPGRSMTGEVDYLYDTLDPATRTVKARVTVSNADGTLRPGMYATAVMRGQETEARPTVPSEAVVSTGERSVVLLAQGDGRFRPVEVETGLEADGRTQITNGLSGDERVVTSAQFLIDSEARLQSAVGAMSSGHNHDNVAMASMEDDGGRMPSSHDGMNQTGREQAGDMKTMEVNVYAADADDDGLVYQCEPTPHLIADTPEAVNGCDEEPSGVTIGAAQTILHYAGYTNVPVDVAAADTNGNGFVYQDAMDWAVLHDGPGRCEVCGMELKRVTLEEARENLRREGYTLMR